MYKKNTFIKQAGILAIAGFVSRIIGIIYRRPLTELIGLEGIGYYSLAFNIYATVLLISSYSIPSALSKEIAKTLALKNYKNAQRIFYCTIFYVVLVGGFASLFTYVFADFLAEKNSAIILRVFAPTIFLSGILGVMRGYFQGYGSMLQTSTSQIIEQVFNGIISVLAAYLLLSNITCSNGTSQAIYGAMGAAIGTGIGVLSAILFMIWIYIINRKMIQNRIKKSTLTNQVEPYKKIFINILFTVTPFIFSTAIYNFNIIMNQTIYTKVLINLKGITEEVIASQYAILFGEAVVIANIPIALASSMSSAMIPKISSIYLFDNKDTTNRQVDLAVRFTMLLSIPAFVGLFVLASPLVQILFPQKASLTQASYALMGISITVVFYSLSTLTNAVLQGIDKVNVPVKNALFSLILQSLLLLVMLLVTDWTLVTLIIVTVVNSFLMCLLNAISVYKNLGYRFNLKQNFIIPFVAAVIMGGIAKAFYLIIYHICKINLFSLLFSIIIAVIVYFILIIKLGGIGEDEIRNIPQGEKIIKFAKRLKLL